jgi:hypothetical protein
MELINSYLNTNSYCDFQNEKDLILDFESHLRPI